MGIHRHSLQDICYKKNTTTTEIIKWCITHFGDFNKYGVPIWEFKSHRNDADLLWIYDDEHAMMFALKWL